MTTGNELPEFETEIFREMMKLPLNEQIAYAERALLDLNAAFDFLNSENKRLKAENEALRAEKAVTIQVPLRSPVSGKIPADAVRVFKADGSVE